MRTALGIDIGGTGFRWIAEDGRREGTAGLQIGASGVDAPGIVEQIAREVSAQRTERGLDDPAAVALGMSGILRLSGDPAAVHQAIRRVWPEARTIVASDAVTTLVGALGLDGGVVVAAGTGVIAFGSDLEQIWRRVDGWGHILGDKGGGAWIGTRGLRAALRAHDDRPGGSKLLRSFATERFGDLDGLPMAIYPRADRAAVLASFVPDVVAAADIGDSDAASILRRAGEHLGEAAAAAHVDDLGPDASLVGGIAQISEILTEAFASTLTSAHLTPKAPLGTSLDGALLLATSLLNDLEAFTFHPPFITKEKP